MALLVLEGAVALNAIGGGCYGLTGAPAVPREWLRGTPFHDYLVPSLLLLVAVGGGMAAAAASLVAGHRRAPQLSMAAGMILVGWIGVQVAMIGYVSWLQPVMLVAGLAVVALAARMVRRG